MRSIRQGINRATNDVEETTPEHEDDQSIERSGPARYTPGAASGRSSDRGQRETVDASPHRLSLALPAREVALTAQRVDPNLVAFFDGGTRVSEQYDKLAIALILAADSRPLKRVLVASAHYGDGRTSVTLNLACALAYAKQRVLVIDGDVHRPSVLRRLGIDAEIGLAEAITDDLPLGAAAMRVQPFGFDVLPSRGSVDNAVKLLASPAFREMLATLDHLYDFILFDSPPLLEAVGSHLLAHLADTTVLVIRAGKTSSSQLAKAIAPLTEENLFGVVLNRARQ
jgi:capsular exopolysaccharide synthesis family protein